MEKRTEQLRPGCDEQSEVVIDPIGALHLSAADLMRLPYSERQRILAAAAAEAEADYRTNPDLTDFAAFGEDDLYDDTPQR